MTLTAPWGMAHYATLATQLAALKAGPPAHDPAARAEAETFLYREARLLDDGHFEAWGSLFDEGGLYWVPANPEGGDPTTEVALAFDDKRRIDDRVFWLLTGLATCQIPPSRTRRLISNVEAWRDSESHLLVRSNFMLHEFRAGRQRILSGWYGHVLVGTGQLSIRTKITFLTDSDQGHDNLTLVF